MQFIFHFGVETVKIVDLWPEKRKTVVIAGGVIRVGSMNLIVLPCCTLFKFYELFPLCMNVCSLSL